MEPLQPSCLGNFPFEKKTGARVRGKSSTRGTKDRNREGGRVHKENSGPIGKREGCRMEGMDPSHTQMPGGAGG